MGLKINLPTLIIILLLIVFFESLLFVEKIEVYPDWQEHFYISLDIYDGGTHCLKSDYSDIYIDTVNRIATIKFNLYKDFYCKEPQEGKIDFKLTNVIEPKIKGIDGLYSLSKTKYGDTYSIILDTPNMGDKQYDVIIKGEILDKFYKNYFIVNNYGPSISYVQFKYDNEKYDCDNCFFLHSGSLKDHGDIIIDRAKNIDKKEYRPNNETEIVFKFYPKLKYKIWLKNVSRSLIISLIAGMVLFLLGDNLKRKKKPK